MEWFDDVDQYSAYLASLTTDERVAILLGFYQLERLGAMRLPDLAQMVPDTTFQRETLMHAADESRHEHLFQRIMNLLGNPSPNSNVTPPSLGGQLIAQALAEWPSLTRDVPILRVTPLLVYLLASEERAVVSFAAHAQLYPTGDEIGTILRQIVSDEKRHVRMIRHRLDRWCEDVPAVRQRVAATETQITQIRAQFLSSTEGDTWREQHNDRGGERSTGELL